MKSLPAPKRAGFFSHLIRIGMENNVVGWFEIPVADMDRAIRFYEAVLGFQLARHPMGPVDMAWFPASENGRGAAGTLIANATFYTPSEKGVLIYFTSPSGDLARELGKVLAAGGEVLIEKRQISPEVGYMGLFKDTEGNRIALHSRK
jgi:predicted enzyme related to lactoylglutathione lyase